MSYDELVKHCSKTWCVKCEYRIVCYAVSQYERPKDWNEQEIELFIKATEIRKDEN